MGQLKLHKHPAEPQPGVQEVDGLSSFAAESDASPNVPAAPWQAPVSARKVPYIAAAFGAMLIVAAATIAFVATRPAGSEAAGTPVVASGTAFIDSRPQGAAIFIDGVAKGATPSRIALTAGQHTLELKMDDADRSFPLNVEAGTTVTTDHHLLSLSERRSETLFTGMRLSAGIDRGGFHARFGIDPWVRYQPDLDPFVQAGFVWERDGRMGLSRPGMLIANEILVTFV